MGVQDRLTDPLRPALIVLMAASGLVPLLACRQRREPAARAGGATESGRSSCVSPRARLAGRGSALRIALGGRRIGVTRSILGFEFRKATGHVVTTDGLDHFLQVSPIDQRFDWAGPAGAIQVRIAGVDGTLGYLKECRQPLSRMCQFVRPEDETPVGRDYAIAQIDVPVPAMQVCRDREEPPRFEGTIVTGVRITLRPKPPSQKREHVGRHVPADEMADERFQPATPATAIPNEDNELRGGEYRQKVADYELVRPRNVVLQIEASVTSQKKRTKIRRRHIVP